MRDKPTTSPKAALMMHLARHRLSVFDAIRLAPGLEELGDVKLRRTLQDAERCGVVASAPLHAGLRCWRLTHAGREEVDLPTRLELSFSERAKLRAYGLLHHCFFQGPRRSLLTKAEVSTAFPDLARRGAPSGYCYEAATRRLTLARVDLTATGRWDRCLGALVAVARWHLTMGAFRQLAGEGRFTVVLMTATPSKAQRLATALAASAKTSHLPVHVIAAPTLAPLCGPQLVAPLAKEARRRTRR